MTTSITYTATLDIPRETVLHLAAFLRTERRRLRTRRSTRSLGCFKQAVMVIRGFFDGARVRQLAHDNGLSTRTAYRYPHEGSAYSAKEAWATPHTLSDQRPCRTSRRTAPDRSTAPAVHAGEHGHVPRRGHRHQAEPERPRRAGMRTSSRPSSRPRTTTSVSPRCPSSLRPGQDSTCRSSA
ncbi:hypothetical protein [Streptomyces sp. BoleA5]|uniref:hypothetical protein n=1 Tax=Streptomyces sp. BoleA5 TaxID=1157637 RepID=UPI000365A1E3|nr:hypothetical protein [Streptomyces sp. SID8377]MYX37035.1 hypothetical protein [Streptomyces sp. SID8377]